MTYVIYLNARPEKARQPRTKTNKDLKPTIKNIELEIMQLQEKLYDYTSDAIELHQRITALERELEYLKGKYDDYCTCRW